MATVVRWNPVRDAVAMQNTMDRLFEEVWRNPNTRTNNASRSDTRPLAVDIYENDATYTLVTALPGINPEAIEINLHDNVLTISGEVTQPELPEDMQVRLQERHFGKFSRSIKLPNEVDGDNVSANYENGVLVLSLPKVPEAQPRTIPVRVNGAVNQN